MAFAPLSAPGPKSKPTHEAAMQRDAVENTPENKAIQVHAAVQSYATPVENTEGSDLPAIEEYTISVEQVRDDLRARGLAKSKDTVQRWCRSGDLDCRKRGVLNRFFTTEASLNKLERKLLPDMIAEEVGPVMPHAAAHAETSSSNQTDAPSDTEERSRVQLHAPDDAGASTGMPMRDTEHAAGQSETLAPLVEVAEFARASRWAHQPIRTGASNDDVSPRRDRLGKRAARRRG
jgi:hypothetical protein